MTKVFKDPIFNLAVLFSLAAHIFWLSMVTVKIAPTETKPIRFSRVSFLGPAPERRALEVAIGFRERSLLEKRFIEKTRARNALLLSSSKPSWQAKANGERGDRRLVDFIEDAVTGSKLEPLYIID